STDDGHAVSWHIAGSYLEACNCEAICPCRRIGGVQGGRSTYGECLGALSWIVEEGHADAVDLAGMSAVLASRYHDDEPGSPWTYALFVDARGDEQRRKAMADILTGRVGGTPYKQFPWVFKEANLLGVEAVEIEIDHTPGRGWFRADGSVQVRMRELVADQEPVTCVIPGHHRQGRELISETIDVAAGPVTFSVSGRCAYESTFEYSSDDS
ncbi:MAG: DUF1326 domain-containing protein, partial [Thermoleophilaceae bacterium]